MINTLLNMVKLNNSSTATWTEYWKRTRKLTIINNLSNEHAENESNIENIEFNRRFVRIN